MRFITLTADAKGVVELLETSPGAFAVNGYSRDDSAAAPLSLAALGTFDNLPDATSYYAKLVWLLARDALPIMGPRHG